MARFNSQDYSASNYGMIFASNPDNQPSSQYIYLSPDSSEEPQRSFPKWLLPVAIGFAAILIIAILIVVAIPSKTPEKMPDDTSETDDGPGPNDEFAEQDLADEYSFEAALAEEDDLNSVFAVAVSENPYASYTSSLDHTVLLEYGTIEVCALLSVSCSELAHPEELPYFTKVPAVNTNALDYYLDVGHIVIISAFGEYPYTSNGGTLVIYAVNYAQGQEFKAFVPPFAGGISPILDLRRDSVINGIVGVPNCYVSTEVFNGP